MQWCSGLLLQRLVVVVVVDGGGVAVFRLRNF
jgi:hypothetical protein